VIEGVTYWNDSKATNFHAVEAALARFTAPVLLIAGGKAKGGDLTAFVRRIAPRVKQAFLIGDTRAALAAACAVHGVLHRVCETFEEAIHAAAGQAGPGDHVLLSPGFASFDMFRSYEHRGDQFEQLVNRLGSTVVVR
jgi:UDP-N-acetylmuramoylalanine--D-glutamate ligase